MRQWKRLLNGVRFWLAGGDVRVCMDKQIDEFFKRITII